MNKSPNWAAAAAEPAAAPAGRRDQRLGLADTLDALVADGLATRERSAELLARSGGERRHPLVVIAECDWENASQPGQKLSLDALVHWLAAHAGLPYHRIDPLSLDVARVTQLIPYAYAARARILPIKVTPTEIVVATAEPWLRDWERDLAPALKRDIRRVLASPADLDRYIVEFYALARSVKASSEQRGKQAPGAQSIQNLEQLTELGKTGKLTADDQHVVAIVDWLLSYAFEQRASDIHLEPRRERGNIRFRIDGVLHEVYQVPASVMPAVTSRIKILARMDLAEKRKPQDGRIKTRSPGGKEIELRVSSLPTAFGEKLVMRIFDPEVLLKDFNELGLTVSEAAIWRDMIAAANGIILVTGPTGSGKTTTLYSTLRHLATPDVNVCTIEDPIELVEPAFNQMQVQPNIDLTFASGVRALLRQDPDIIMVGEIRDLETAENAIQAALTGHLVLSTLHTNDAPSAITRLLDLGVPPYLIKATVVGVVAQRLVRTLCPHCKQPVTLDAERWQELIGRWKRPPPEHAQAAAGCLECRETGFLGRAGIYEILQMSPAVRAGITASTDPSDLRALAIRDGMTPLRIAGSDKVAAGITTIDEVLRCSPDAPELAPTT
ncbi:MAG: type secretory pathway, ATPase PulE [Hydrocarboniphaga sp.]|uniref:GspE/PulE family protein n=1 Tax=Hydrocarboniphaga sp. TaxID=2033016 RepID=UPI002637BB87|nr:GspE/PulE family protein [Hydrocarboniphaga sp.]MDB5969544.1 type secretory pathway, ATPase PulE [Hydrocarboniphaga sp.]